MTSAEPVPSNKSKEETTMMETDVHGAEQAYRHLCDGLATGQWKPFFACLADEVDVIWPYPPAAGHYTGADGRSKIMEFFSALGGEGNRITEVTVTVTGKSVSTDRIVFEDVSKGEFFGQPYQGRHCIHLVMSAGKIIGFLEYTAPTS
jgi:ketosteroid isomerase-like protein